MDDTRDSQNQDADDQGSSGGTGAADNTKDQRLAAEAASWRRQTRELERERDALRAENERLKTQNGSLSNELGSWKTKAGEVEVLHKQHLVSTEAANRLKAAGFSDFLAQGLAGQLAAQAGAKVNADFQVEGSWDEAVSAFAEKAGVQKAETKDAAPPAEAGASKSTDGAPKVPDMSFILAGTPGTATQRQKANDNPRARDVNMLKDRLGGSSPA